MFLKQSTNSQNVIIGPFLDDTDGKTAETGLSIGVSDVRLGKNGGNIVAKNSGGATHDELGFYQITLDSTDTSTVGELLIAVHMTGALPVFKHCYVLEEAIYDAMFGASASAFDSNARVDVASIEGLDATDQINAACDTALSDYDAPTKAEMDSAFSTTNGKIDVVDGIVDNILLDTAEIGTAGAGLTAVPWNSSWDAEVQSECNDALVALGLDHLVSASVAGSDITDNSIVAKLVSSSATADWDDFVNTTDSLQAIRDRGDAAWTTGSGGGGGSGPTASEIADAVWDEAASGHNTGGTFGKYVRQLKEGIISVESAINDASATTTSFVTDLTEATDDHYNGKTLTFISGNLSNQSRVVSDYNGTTKTLTFDEAFTEAPADNDEFIILTPHSHTVTEIKEAVRTEMDSNSTKLADIVADTAEIGTAGAGLTAVPWNSSWDAEVQSECADALTAHWGAAMTESYASDNAAATPVQMLHMIYCAVSQFTVSSTTITGYQIDGSTTAMTWTLDDASNPTERKRAT